MIRDGATSRDREPMTADEHPVAFGDAVRAVTAPETEALGVAGLPGSVTGVSMPAISGVPVVGVVTDDHAYNVRFEETGKEYWLSRALIEFVDHAPGTVIELTGVIKKWVRSADGRWVELAAPSDATTETRPASGSLFQRVLSLLKLR